MTTRTSDWGIVNGQPTGTTVRDVHGDPWTVLSDRYWYWGTTRTFGLSSASLIALHGPIEVE